MDKISKYFNNLFSEKYNTVLLLFVFLFFSIYISLLFPEIRNLIITTTEYVLKRSISSDHWNNELIAYNNHLLLIIILFIASIFLNLIKIIPRIITIHRNAFNQKKWVRLLTILLPWITVILFFLIPNIDNPDFWWDESGQFWISKGQNHFSEPYTDTGNLSDILRNNAEYNLDPGGFSILLYFWTSISNHQAFIRLLPSLFFIFSMVTVTKIALLWYPDNLLSYFAGFILLISNLIKYYAFELRPYSMEMFTTILAIYWCYKDRQILESKISAIIAGLSLALCMTSRYSSLFSVLAVSLIIFIKLLQKRTIKQKIINFILYISPIIISGLSIYIFMLRFQNPGANSPDYVNKYMLSSGNYLEILLNRDAIMVYGPFIMFLAVQLINKLKTKDKYATFLHYTITLNLIFILSSIIGIYPWSFTTKWDISTHSLFIITLLPLVYNALIRIGKSKSSNSVLQGLFSIGFIAIALLSANSYRYTGLGSISNIFKECKVFTDENAHVAGNPYAAPSIRYLFEYGPFKGYMSTYQNMSMSNRKELDDLDFILLQPWIDDSYEIMNRIKNDDNWKLCSIDKYSMMYKNIR